MSTSQLTLPLTKAQAYALVDAVMERDDLAISAAAREEEETEEWIFEAICTGEPDLDAFNALAREVLGGEIGFSIEEMDTDIDWVAKSLEGLKPVTAGGFCVYGGHDAEAVPHGLTPLHIEAGQAFGTGHHETTTGCLIAIDERLKRGTPRRMLDVGTGSGVLAIALAKRTHARVIASDIDPVSVQVTEENARLNGVGNLLVGVRAAGLSHRTIRNGGPYDLIVANILAGPLKTLAPDIGHVAERGATIILSGILAHQAARITAAYAEQGMVLKSRIPLGDWVTLVLEKRGR